MILFTLMATRPNARILMVPLVALLFHPVLPSASAVDPPTEAETVFEKEVRPVLVQHCQRCHGPRKQESGLRVDSREAMLKGGVSGPGIVPGKPDQGTILAAVHHRGDIAMPPDEKLADRQIAALAKWVAAGAVWPQANTAPAATQDSIAASTRKHWAFQPVQAPAVPKTQNSTWPASDIDRFILARLETAKLPPAPPADKRTLLRRVTFDLTGLPPTPAEIAAFLADTSPDAFAKVVDRLLASPHYGERWGRHWLDVARYADTAGDGADYPVREAYKYRDWVITAFNKDLPYDQFIRQQIAGDILAKNAPADQYDDYVTATGFLAIGKRYGYSPKPDYQYLDFADVIESVGRSLLGLSLGCARCHDHKYEPVSIEDYYALYGIFQSTQWAFPGGEEHKRPAHFPPLVPPAEVARLEQVKAQELAQLDSEIAKLNRERGQLDGTGRVGGLDLGLENQPLGKPPAGVWLSAGPNAVLAEAQSPFAHVHPTGTRGVRVGSSAANNGVRYVFRPGLRAVAGQKMHFTIDFRTVAPTDKTGAYRFYLGQGVIASTAVDCSVTPTEFAIKNGSKWEVIRKLTPGTWYTLQLTIDHATKTFSGQVGTANDRTTFENKSVFPGWNGVIDTFICDGNGHVAGPAATRDLDNLGLSETAFPAVGSTTPAVAPLPADAQARIQKLDAEITAITKRRADVQARVAYPVAYAVSEGKPMNVRVQLRGEPDRLGAEVPRRFLSVLGGDPVPANEPGSGRLQLAEWITRPTNPLTARVFVNRVWQGHFGRGLVATASDFGLRGSPPSHPELLDHLTARFMASGWSTKSLHRWILLSNVYQQSSLADEAGRAADPENILWGRFPRQPLDAESIRDGMLAISGLLDRTPPQEHPFPPVETWAFTIHRPFHAVYESNHRGVYLMRQRNSRHPFLSQFDAADPNLSVAERKPTITPKQSLYLMNSPFMHTQSTAFAQALLQQPGDAQAHARAAFEQVHGRVPDDSTIAEAVTFVETYQNQLTQGKPPTPAQTVAAWAALGRVLFMSNGFLYVD
ncbi:MAG: PSD1 and planctomycete cytochrome C domain-containing protein [Bacteroidales bacterium]|nr:PSD1 and planctomycete cytochrome C domain-containing protein [Bacteroidales bacterium]